MHWSSKYASATLITGPCRSVSSLSLCNERCRSNITTHDVFHGPYAYCDGPLLKLLLKSGQQDYYLHNIDFVYEHPDNSPLFSCTTDGEDGILDDYYVYPLSYCQFKRKYRKDSKFAVSFSWPEGANKQCCHSCHAQAIGGSGSKALSLAGYCTEAIKCSIPGPLYHSILSQLLLRYRES